MPRYFFHLHDNGPDLGDDEGMDLPDIQAARLEAVRLAGSLLADRPDSFWASDEWMLEVKDEAQMVLFTLRILVTEAPTPAKDG